MKHITPYFIIAALLSCSLLSCSHSAHENEEEHEKEKHHHENAITLSPHQAKDFGVVVGELTPSKFAEVIKVSGMIEPTSTGRNTVTARRSGIVTLASGLSVGASVRQGSPIASISSRGIQGGDVNAAAVAIRDATKRELDRLRPLYNEGLITAAALNEAEKAYKEAAAGVGASPGGGTETSPIAGNITAIFVSSGDFVETGAPIATIARDVRLTLRADVPQRFASSIPGIVSANFHPDCSEAILSISELNGKAVSPGSINPAVNGYIPVYFTFSSTPETQPGSFAEIYLIGNERGNVLTLPREALVEMQGNYYAYVRSKDDDDAYSKRLVRIGASDGRNYEIIDGLKEGDMVVMKGATVIRMAETSAIAPPGHSHNH